ncbi:YidB family protein [Bradyrhizobium sp. 2TAF24]|uniref:YidB family protein n=1 Tax=Bradyrhizobium sp. 2TAF24 TaxID=3233011 RepID=UPI003F8E74A5
MGLLDILNGMQNGPRGPSAPSDPSKSSGGMSPLTMAILALLAYKAVKKIGGSHPTTAAPAGAPPAPTPASLPGSTGGLGGLASSLGGSSGGGLGDLLKGGLGGLLAGGAAGTVLSGGLGDLLKQFQDSGHGDTASTWVGSGPNKAISPGDLANALGVDQINELVSQSGMSREALLQGLSQHLPEVINQLTPNGRLPTDHEASHWL